MAVEPITLFARIADPALTARTLRELCPSVEIDGGDDDWTCAVIAFGDGRKKQTLTFTHNPQYYAEPNWSTQMSGMRGYFSKFPDTENKEKVLLLTTALQFSLGCLFEPDYDPGGDPRLSVLFDVAEALDGVLFTPSSLRDAQGRVLFSAGGEGEEDPDAIWPRVLAEVSVATPLGAAAHEASRPSNAEEIDDDENADPPTAERVARRALALSAVTARAILEQDVEKPETEETYQNLLAWVRDIAIDDEFEPDEWQVLQRPLGRLDNLQQVSSTWRLEGLVVLAWALGRFEIPPHDQLVEVNPLWRSLGLLNVEASRAMLAEAALRPRGEIETLRERLFAIHWRMRNFHLRPEAMDFAEFARTSWFGPLDVSGLPLIDGDIVLEGARIDQASEDACTSAHSASQERHQAANWLCEGPTIYSHASVAT